MLKYIYVDLDGVIFDMCFAAASLFMPPTEARKLVDEWPIDCPDITVLLGISKGQFWKAVDNAPNFWDNLPKFHWTDELVKYLHSLDVPVFVCTSPSSNPDCVAGKLRSLQKNKIVKHRHFVITPHKFLLARPDAVLIDDNDKKCNEFRDNGGKVLQFPMMWGQNRNATLMDGRMAIDNKLEYVKEVISLLNS